jgi:hypothetical protein
VVTALVCADVHHGRAPAMSCFAAGWADAVKQRAEFGQQPDFVFLLYFKFV